MARLPISSRASLVSRMSRRSASSLADAAAPVASWAPAMRSASGSRPHIRISSLAAVPVQSDPAAMLASSPGGVLLGQRAEADEAGPGQPGQPVPAGHQHQARRSGRDQRPDLLLVGRVVQQDQAPAVGEKRPVDGGELVDIGRQFARGQPEAPGEPGEDLPGRHRVLARPAQVGEELAVWVLGGQQVCRVCGEGGLAHAGQARDHPDRRRGRR
jgi:hypothetical protein